MMARRLIRLEQQLVPLPSHPDFGRAIGLMREALVPYPDALAAVVQLWRSGELEAGAPPEAQRACPKVVAGLPCPAIPGGRYMCERTLAACDPWPEARAALEQAMARAAQLWGLP